MRGLQGSPLKGAAEQPQGRAGQDRQGACRMALLTGATRASQGLTGTLQGLMEAGKGLRGVGRC